MTPRTAPATAPTRRHVPSGSSWLLARWPTLLAVALGTLLLADLGDGTENAVLLLVTAVTYLLTAVIGRPAATWPALFAAFVGVVGLQALGTPGDVLLGTAVAVLALAGLLSGAVRRTGSRLVQAPASIVFTSAGLLATSLDLEVGVALVAVGLVLHACWDALHWWSDRVVRRSFAEWCGVLDLTVGVGLLILV